MSFPSSFPPSRAPKFGAALRRAAPAKWLAGLEVAAASLLALVLVAAIAGAEPASKEAGERLDVNRAGVEALAGLPGVGPAKALAIVSHREAEGAFRSLDDLEAVRGIGPALIERLRDRVRFGEAPTGAKKAAPRSRAPASGPRATPRR